MPAGTQRQTAGTVAQNHGAVLQCEAAEVGNRHGLVDPCQRVLLRHTVGEVARHRVVVVLVAAGIQADSHLVRMGSAQHRGNRTQHLNARQDGVHDVEYRRVQRGQADVRGAGFRGRHLRRKQAGDVIASHHVYDAVVASLVKAQRHQRAGVQRPQTDQLAAAAGCGDVGRIRAAPCVKRVVLHHRPRGRVKPRCRHHRSVIVKGQPYGIPCQAVRRIHHDVLQIHHLVAVVQVALHHVEEVGRTLGVVAHGVGTMRGLERQQVLRLLVKCQVVGGVHQQAVADSVAIRVAVAAAVVLVHLDVQPVEPSVERVALEGHRQRVVVKVLQVHMPAGTQRQTAGTVAHNHGAVLQSEAAEVGNRHGLVDARRHVPFHQTVSDVGWSRVVSILVAAGIQAYTHLIRVACAQRRRHGSEHLAAGKGGVHYM